jgi:hypothetical protein
MGVDDITGRRVFAKWVLLRLTIGGYAFCGRSNRIEVVDGPPGRQPSNCKKPRSCILVNRCGVNMDRDLHSVNGLLGEKETKEARQAISEKYSCNLKVLEMRQLGRLSS